jgi:hypothetical protein
MNIPDYIPKNVLARPVDYEWTRVIANEFQANPGENHPKLFKALELISVRAAYALGVACSEWAAARLEALTDVSDLLARIEAAWAAGIDWRYAELPEPKTPKGGDEPDPVAEAQWLTALFLVYEHKFLLKTYQGTKNKGVRGTTLRLALLVQHIAGKKSGFDTWLAASLRKAAERYPARDVPIQQEAPVPPDFFAPDFKWSSMASAESEARLGAALNPSQNRYLRKPDKMRSDGFKGDPYPSSGKKR